MRQCRWPLDTIAGRPTPLDSALPRDCITILCVAKQLEGPMSCLEVSAALCAFDKNVSISCFGGEVVRPEQIPKLPEIQYNHLQNVWCIKVCRANQNSS